MQVPAADAAATLAVDGRDGSYFPFHLCSRRIARYTHERCSDRATWASTTAVVWAALPDLWPPDAPLTSQLVRNTITKKMNMTNQQSNVPGEKPLTSIADAAYSMAVLTLYIDLPDTPRRASSYDKTVARSLFEQGVPLDVVESALLLGSLRRLVRPQGSLPLPRIRSLAYFSAVIAELQGRPMPTRYLDYLRNKAGQAFPKTAAAQD